MKVALGFKAHSGWAVVVVVGRDGGGAPRVLERGRVELVLAQQRPWGKAPYHAAEPLAPDAAHELVQRAIAGAHAAAEDEMRRLVARLRAAGHDIASCGVLVGAPMPAWTTEQIRAVHLRMHQAEGALFPAALSRAAEACGLRVVQVEQKTLQARAAGDDIRRAGPAARAAVGAGPEERGDCGDDRVDAMTVFDIAADPTAPASAPCRALELGAADVPALQRFFERHPDYFHAVIGQPPRPVEAQEEYDDAPPAGMPYGRRWLLQFVDAGGEMVGMASLVSDFLAAGVWHIGLFVVATPLHGQGVAARLYGALERWMAGQGAQWIRLGAVIGNDKAERFWRKHGYVEVRQRAGVAIGQRIHTLRVFAKPLAGGSIAQYLERVARDRPESTLP
jgi:GNAT superfamily N-acetyltransferase